MRAKITAILGIALLILAISALSTSTVFAKGATEHETVVKDSSGAEVEEATMTLKGGVIKIEAETKSLAAGHVFSVWGKVNDEPSFNLAGFISDDDGEAGFSGTVQVNKDVLLTGFVIKIKDHGEPVKGLIHKQKTTKDANCPPASCSTVQTAIFDLP